MLARLFLLFTLLPLVELVLLVQLGRATSVWVVLALVLGAGIAGAWLARRYGAQSLTRVRAEMAQGRLPAEALWDSLLIFLAAVLLIMPGVLGDVVAIVLLVPFTRRIVKRFVAARLRARFRMTTLGTGASPADGRTEIIDVRVIDPTAERLR